MLVTDLPGPDGLPELTGPGNQRGSAEVEVRLIPFDRVQVSPEAGWRIRWAVRPDLQLALWCSHHPAVSRGGSIRPGFGSPRGAADRGAALAAQYPNPL